MHRVIRVSCSPEYRSEVTFEDGLSVAVDVDSRLFGTMFEPLRDPVLFAQVRVDEYGAVCWPNGAALAPDALHAALVRRG